MTGLTGFQVKEKLQALESEIQREIKADTYVLNTKIMKLLEQEEELRFNCPHKYENGRCVYCNKKEKK